MPRQARPWFRYYSESLENRKLQALPAELFKAYINLLSLANRSDERGTLPRVADIGYALRLDVMAAGALIDELKARRFLEGPRDRMRIHDWAEWQKDSDANLTPGRQGRNAERTPKERAKNAERTDDAGLRTHREEESRGELETEQEPDKNRVPPYVPPVRSGGYQLLQKTFGRLITAAESELFKALEEEHPPERIEYGLTVCAMRNIKTLAFLKGVCENRDEQGDNGDAGRPRASAVLSRSQESNEQYRAELARYGVKPVERV